MKNKIILFIISIVICLILLSPQMLGGKNIPNNTISDPRIYSDVHFILITNVYASIEIDGYHNLKEGYGNDDIITLQESNKIRLFGALIIHNGSDILESNRVGGWIHSKIEVINYHGWMADQNSNQHLKMLGFCNEIIITTYR